MQVQKPDFKPIEASAQWDDAEAQIKQLSLEVLRGWFRAYERELNVYGAPHLGSFELVERWVKADGLSMVRGSSEEAMRYLFKAWRARNPKRGLHFIRTYLQLLWPGQSSIEQLWHETGKSYPEFLDTKDEVIKKFGSTDGHFLTSRVLVEVDADDERGDSLASVQRALRSALGAKFLLLCRLLKGVKVEIGMVAFTQGSQHPRIMSEVAGPGELTEQSCLAAASIIRSSARVIAGTSAI